MVYDLIISFLAMLIVAGGMFILIVIPYNQLGPWGLAVPVFTWIWAKMYYIRQEERKKGYS